MNDDRCDHVAVSPGQAMCSCTSRRVFLENLVRLQAQRICELEATLYKPQPRLITITGGNPVKKSNPLTDVLPPKFRKYLFAGYSLAVVATGIYAIFAHVPDQLIAIEAALAAPFGATAASNIKPKGVDPV